MSYTKRPGFQREVDTSANFVSTENSSSVALANGETFTGEWQDVSKFRDIMLAVSTDQNGIYNVQFSPDGVNIDSTLVRYYNTFSFNVPHRFTVTRAYFRVTFTNDSGFDQTYFRLQTSVGSYSNLNIPLDSTIAQDYDAIAVRPSNFSDEVALGRRQGYTLWNKWGYNPDVDTGAPEMIWSPGGDLVFMTTADTLEVVSTSALDTSAGTGARTIEITGIDSTRRTQTETVIMNGLTPVTTVNTWLGVNRVRLLSAGTDRVNGGSINITNTTLGNIQAQLPALGGVTQQCIFFVQEGHTFLAENLFISALKLSGGGAPRVTVKAYVFDVVSNTVAEVFRLNLDTAVENTLDFSPPSVFPIPESSVLYLSAETDTNNTAVSARFTGFEVRGEER